jgi:hypothetical protein
MANNVHQAGSARTPQSPRLQEYGHHHPRAQEWDVLKFQFEMLAFFFHQLRERESGASRRDNNYCLFISGWAVSGAFHEGIVDPVPTL